MIYEAILFLVSAILLAALGIVVHNYITCQLAYWSFKKKSNNLPILKDRRLLGNHVTTWPARKNLCNEFSEEHEKLGKTIGALYNDKFVASTIDLDVAKLIIYDEPNLHINRIRLNLPLKEMEGSLLIAEDDKWRKLRRHFGPAFK